MTPVLNHSLYISNTIWPLLDREPVDEVLQMPPSLLTCGGCQQSIGDRFFLKAIEQYWHEDCLSCDLCGCRLGEVGRRLYYKLGRKLCRRDYLRLVWCQNLRLTNVGSLWGFLSWCLTCIILSGSSDRTAYVLPVRRGSVHLKWPCECGTKFTTLSVSNVQHARSTFAWETATCWSTRTLCVSRISLSGLNSTVTAWCRGTSCPDNSPVPEALQGAHTLLEHEEQGQLYSSAMLSAGD